jgi:hypothetical protein
MIRERWALALILLSAGALAAEQAVKARVIPAGALRGDTAQSVAFSPDGKYVAAGFGGPTTGRHPLRPNGGGVAVWEAASGKRVFFHEEFGDVTRLAFTPDGKSLVYFRSYTAGCLTEDNAVVVLDARSGRVRKAWGENDPSGFALTRAAVLVGKRVGGRSRVYSLGDLQPQKGPGRLNAQALASSADGRWLAVVSAAKGGLTLFEGLAERRALRDDALSSCFALAVGPGGKLVATGHPKGVVRVWDTAKGAAVRTIDLKQPGHAFPFFSPDGKVLAVGTQSTRRLRWYQEAPGQEYRRERSVAPAGCEVVFYDAATFQRLRRWRFEDGAYRTWYARTTKAGDLYPEYNPARFAFSPDGKAVLAGCNGAVLVEAASGKVIRRLAAR